MMKQGFGKWIRDGHGMPAFSYEMDEFRDDRAFYFTTSGGSRDHFHLFGNDAWFALALNHGQVFCIDPRRGFTRVGAPTRPCKKGKIPWLGMGAVLLGGAGITGGDDGGDGTKGGTSGGEVLTDVSWGNEQVLSRRVLGCGYFEKQRTVPGRLELVNRMVAVPGDAALVVSEISIKNTGKSGIMVYVASFWDIFLYPISKSLIVSADGRREYAKSRSLNGLARFLVSLQRLARMDTDGARFKHASRILYRVPDKLDEGVDEHFLPARTCIVEPSHPKGKEGRENRPSGINHHYLPCFLSVLDGDLEPRVMEKWNITIPGGISFPVESQALGPGTYVSNDQACLVATGRIFLQPGEEKTFRLLFGIEHVTSIKEHVRRVKRMKDLVGLHAKTLQGRRFLFSTPCAAWLARETAWHAASLLASTFRDDYTGFHRVPQGSIYLLGHGFDGSVRDFALFIYPLTFISPSLAREFLLFVYSMVKPDGKVPYAFHGFGKILEIPLVHSNPSDQYFFVLWITCEYVYLTRDFGFLSEEVCLRDARGRERTFTVAEIMRKLVDHVLSDEVGIGPHGLVRVRDGDWNDGITLMVKNRRAFVKDGESMLNSAMLALVFPRVATMLRDVFPDTARLAEDVALGVYRAIMTANNGKWFFRGYDGLGNPIGDEAIFLDHHVWLLVNGDIPAGKRATVAEEIARRLDSPCKIGAYLRDPPADIGLLPRGWDVNGGTWHAINALLVWGYRLLDPGNALRFIEKISMENRARQYPGIWYGIWSGPDAYNADHAERPGEAFYHMATPMCDFPFMNNNLHAGFLSACIRFAGIDAGPGGISVDLLHEHPFILETSLLTVRHGVEEDNILISELVHRPVKITLHSPLLEGEHLVQVDPSRLEYSLQGSSITVELTPEVTGLPVSIRISHPENE